MRYDYDDGYEIYPEDVRDAYKRIEKLTRGYDDRRIFTKSVNRVFYDIFGINDIGTIFGSRSRTRRDTAFRVDVFRKCGVKRIVSMILDDDTYNVIRTLVKLHYDVTHSTDIKRDKVDEAETRYHSLIAKIKDRYNIKTVESVSSITNSFKAARILDREYGEDDYYDGYGRRRYRDDDYYDDDDDYSYGRRRRRRDDYYEDDTEFVDAIMKGVDDDEPDYKRRSKRNRKSDSRSSRRDDYDDDDDDFESATAETFAKVAENLEKTNARIDKLERMGAFESRDDNYYEPRRRRRVVDDYIPDDDQPSGPSLDELTEAVRALAANQRDDRETLNDVIDMFKKTLDEQIDYEDEELPPNLSESAPSKGDLIKTQGGVHNST